MYVDNVFMDQLKLCVLSANVTFSCCVVDVVVVVVSIVRGYNGLQICHTIQSYRMYTDSRYS